MMHGMQMGNEPGDFGSIVDRLEYENDRLRAENKAMVSAVIAAANAGKPAGEIPNIMLAARRKVRRQRKK